MKNTSRRQAGMTLLVTLIMLVLLTLLVLTGGNLSNSNLQAVGNLQQRDVALNAAREAVEEVISSKRFYETPNAVFQASCGSANTKCIDTNGDNVTDVTVVITPAPSCVKAQVIKNTSLDLSVEDDIGCSVGAVQTFGMAGANTSDSLCSNSVWQIRAEATDAVTGAKVVETHGVAVRVSNDNIATSCP